VWALGFQGKRNSQVVLAVVKVFEITKCSHDSNNVKRENYFARIKLKSLILAQIERWRHALHMQVERESGAIRK
jgi:hypothetical protein